uniref:Uncharacterized protein n=1 Tax=Panagrolaimus sp. ES5 TaxID=591445 RepID=A0AC34FNQ7_9BILA
MWCSLNQTALISSDQIGKIDAFLNDESPISTRSNAALEEDERMPSDDETEADAGVEQWTKQMEVESVRALFLNFNIYPHE